MATLIVVLLSIVVTYYMNRIISGWELVLSLGAGTGLVYILRWYWWRVNAWSEIAAMASALIVSLGLRQLSVIDVSTPKGFAQEILVTVGVTTAVWIGATFLTAPEPMEKLSSFYRSVRPAGPGWKPVSRTAGLPEQTGQILPNVLNWILGVVLVYSALFSIGELIFGVWSKAILLIALGAVAGGIMIWNLNRTGWAGISEKTDNRLPEALPEGAD